MLCPPFFRTSVHKPEFHGCAYGAFVKICCANQFSPGFSRIDPHAGPKNRAYRPKKVSIAYPHSLHSNFGVEAEGNMMSGWECEKYGAIVYSYFTRQEGRGRGAGVGGKVQSLLRKVTYLQQKFS